MMLKQRKVIKLKSWRMFWYNVGLFLGWPPCVLRPWAQLDAEYKAMSYEDQASIAVDYAVYGTDLATAIKKKIKRGPHLIQKTSHLPHR